MHHPRPIHPLPPQDFILKEVTPFNWSVDKEEDSKELQLKAEEDAEDTLTAAFMDAPIRRRRKQRPFQSSSESSASELFDPKESDSSDSPSEGFFDGSSDGFDSGEDEGEEEEMEYQALDYP